MHFRNDLSKDELVNGRTVCEKFQISYATLSKWRKDPSKRFPVPKKMGRCLMFSLSEISDWYYADKEVSPTPLNKELCKSLDEVFGDNS